MKAYSMELRQQVVAACDAREGTQEEIAARFSVSVPWIRKLLRQRRETGAIAPRSRGEGQVSAVDETTAVRLQKALLADDFATLIKLARAAGATRDELAMYRAVGRLVKTQKRVREGD